MKNSEPKLIISIFILNIILNIPNTAQPQDSVKKLKDPWTTIVDKYGLDISFLFYEKGNNVQNGIVIMLNNKNEYPIQYSCDLIFRNEKLSHIEKLKGLLNAYEKKTGSGDDLFFLPFEEGVSITEVGIKKLNVKRLN